ncbi:MAG: hypothetical protein AAB263_21355 [Planctomycetota bacterium]
MLFLILALVVSGCSVHREYVEGAAPTEMSLHIDQWNGPKRTYAVIIRGGKDLDKGSVIDVADIQSIKTIHGNGKDGSLPVADLRGNIARVSENEIRVEFDRKTWTEAVWAAMDEVRIINGVYTKRRHSR